MKYCYKCLSPWEGLNQPGTRDICSTCRAGLHVCLNCGFYDTSKSNQCFANVEEPVVYKDRSNFCEEFRFAEKQSPAPADKKYSPDKTREAFNNLFKKK